MGGTLYTSWKDALGASHIDEPVAVFENGKIYTAADGFLGTTAKGVLIGEYEGGIVYTVGTGAFNYGKRLNAVAVIEYGKIYSISKSMLGGISKSLSVGECSCGKVYSHSHKLMEGSESFGLYNGDEEGAAAAAAIALFKLESNVSAHDSTLTGGSSSRSSSSDDDDDLWEKYGLLMPIVVTYRFFKYSFIVGKWIFGAIAWLTGGIIRLVQKHKEKKALEELERAEELPETAETEIDTSSSTDTSVDTDVVVDTITEDTSTDIPKTYKEAIEFEEEVVDVIPAETKKKTDDVPLEIETKAETETVKETSSTSRLKSTMRTHSAEDIAESDKFTPAGDL